MRKIFVGIAHGICLLVCVSVNSWEYIPNPESNYFSLSHTEGRGLGYTQGYSSLDLFLVQPTGKNLIIPFLDLRGHIFNNGKFARNTGIGLRWLNPSFRQVWGVNFFYDFYRTSRLHYHQLGIGLEMLGKAWDFRLNGYLPVGRKKTQIYALSYDFSSGFMAKTREQFAMAGIDAELGYHFCKMQCLDMYAGFGPYAYWGNSKKTKKVFHTAHKAAFGGRASFSVIFLTYCELCATAAYDSRFKWTGQTTFSLNLPFDCWFSNSDVYFSDKLEERYYQPVRRNEIIVIDRINRFSSNPEILIPGL